MRPILSTFIRLTLIIALGIIAIVLAVVVFKVVLVAAVIAAVVVGALFLYNMIRRRSRDSGHSLATHPSRRSLSSSGFSSIGTWPLAFASSPAFRREGARRPRRLGRRNPRIFRTRRRPKPAS